MNNLKKLFERLGILCICIMLVFTVTLQSAQIFAKESVDPFSYSFEEVLNERKDSATISLQLKPEENVVIKSITKGKDVSVLNLKQNDQGYVTTDEVRANATYTYKVTYEISEEQASTVDDTNKPVAEPIVKIEEKEITYKVNSIETPEQQVTKKVARDAGTSTKSQESDFLFNASTKTITGFTSDVTASKDVVIPKQINGVDVLYIGNDAFAGQQITSLTLSDGLLTIGNNAFKNNASLLGAIVIPDTVTSIGTNVFDGCSGITSVKFSSKMTTISNYAFNNCSSLSSITIPSSITTINTNAFNASGLRIVTLPDTVKTIGTYAFANCTQLTSVSLPSALTTIPEYCFFTSTLTSIVIPANVQTIGASSFLYCKNLVSLDFSSATKLKTINSSAFKGTAVVSVELPDSITTLGESVFESIETLTSLKLSANLTTIPTSLCYSDSKLTSILIPEKVTTIKKNAFRFTGFTNIIIPNSVTTIEDSSFPETLVKIEIPTKKSGSISGAPWNLNSTNDTFNTKVYWSDTIETNDFLYDINTQTITNYLGNASTLTVPEEITYNTTTYPVTKVGSFLFKSNTTLESVTLPDNITSLAKGLFFGNTKLKQVKLPANITEIPSYLFNNCASLETITLSDNITQIGEYAFYRTALKSITLPKELQTIGFYAFTNTNLEEITIPSKVTKTGINFYAFNTTVKYIYLPYHEKDSIAEAPWGASSAALYWKGTVKIGSLLYSLDDKSVIGYDGTDTNIVIPNEITYDGQTYPITSIAESAFKSNTKITNVTISSGITSISNNAFQSCVSLVSVGVIPNTVTTIGRSAFAYCSKLTTITLPNKIDVIEQNLLSGASSLKSIIIPNTVTTIESTAFKDCTLLNNVIIPNRVSEIGYEAFKNCKALQDIIIPKSVKKLGPPTLYTGAVFSGCSSLKSVVIEEGSITTLESSTFSDCTTLSKITLPNSITLIDGFAFSNCPNLAEINLPENITEIGSYAFQKCTSLKDIQFGDKVTKLGRSAFTDCTNLKELTLPELINSVDTTTFANCTNLTEIYVMRSRSGAPTALRNNQPWGATNSTVYYSGEFVTFSHTVDKVTGQYKRVINMKAHIEKYDGATTDAKINDITLPDGTIVNVAASDWTYPLTVDANKEYIFKGTDDSGKTVEYKVTINDIGQPTITASDGNIAEDQVSSATKADIVTAVAASAKDELNNDVPMTVSDADLARIRALAITDTSTVTVEANSPYGLSDSTTVILTVTGVRSAIFNSMGGTPTPATQDLHPGDKITKPSNPTKTGYTFGGWYKESTCVNAWNFTSDTMGTESITLYAKWTINQYTVKFVDYNSTVLKTSTLDYGSPIVLPTTNPSRTGYVFIGWTPAVDATVPAKNVTYTATYKQENPFTLAIPNVSYGSKATIQLADVQESAALTYEYRAKSETIASNVAFDTDKILNVGTYVIGVRTAETATYGSTYKEVEVRVYPVISAYHAIITATEAKALNTEADLAFYDGFAVNPSSYKDDVTTTVAGFVAMKNGTLGKYNVEYKNEGMSKTIIMTVVKDGYTLSLDRSFGIYAEHAKMTVTDAKTATVSDILSRMNVEVSVAAGTVADTSMITIDATGMNKINSGTLGKHELTIAYGSDVSTNASMEVLDDSPSALITIPKDIELEKVTENDTFAASATEKVAITYPENSDIFDKNFYVSTAPYFKITSDDGMGTFLVQVYDHNGNKHTDVSLPIATLNGKTGVTEQTFIVKAFKDIVQKNGIYKGTMIFSIQYGE